MGVCCVRKGGGGMRSEEKAVALPELSALLSQYRPAVRGFFLRRAASASEADDLTQEVFVRILKRAGNGAIDNLEGYLFQAAANLLRERGRQATIRNAAKVVEISPDLLSEDEVHTPERILLGREAVHLAMQALYELPERTRAVFLLNRFEEMTGPEIARHLGISISAVEKHMMRALGYLRQRAK